MIIFKEKYDLPDYSIIESKKDFDINIWQPEEIYVVLGRSDSFEQAVNNRNNVHLHYTVVKRPSGGHTVVVSPKTLVISAVFRNSNIKSKEVFTKLNTFIIKVLKEFGVENLQENGISDISIGNKKILGSSIYKKPNFTFYHAVLNHSEEVDLIQSLLNHPRREPDYRKGRSHKDFVTSLAEAGYDFSIEQLVEKLRFESKNI
ncbi:MAG: hypothetical protein JXL97_00790 [Bacteroidales bacterium]|nr:hypothetical protein [Bacteroidales bacterium]